MPVSKFYKPVGNVKVPDPNDPVNMSRSPGMTYFDFGSLPAEVRALAPSRSMRTPTTPTTPTLPPYDYQSDYGVNLASELLKAQPFTPDYVPPGGYPQTKSKPQETYGSNRGGSGMAGRKTSTPQFGSSGFDTGAGYEPLEMPYPFDDKPWELDDNTKADVAPGTSFEPQKDNITDRQPDLNSPAGMYEALSKKYPDILQKNLDQLEQSRVSMEDVDALRDRAGLGSLFIAASKAASGAGSVAGKQPESIAEKIVSREDTLARQNLKDRMDVASENMAMTGKAVDLAMKQINFADEREQYDPNSEVSKFARDFMRSEFELNIPDNVPAYQLKQFLPAMMQKYQTKERIAYQNALLGQKSTDLAARLKSEEEQTKTRMQGAKDVANIQVQGKKDVQAMKPAPGSAAARVLPGTNIPKDIADKEFKMAEDFKGEQAVKKYKMGAIAMQEMQEASKRSDPYGDQALISGYAKILDPESVVREGEYKTVEKGGGLLDSIKNRMDIMSGNARLQPAQREQILNAARALQAGRRNEYNGIRDQYKQRATLYGLEPSRVLGAEEMATPSAGGGKSKRSKAEVQADLDAINAQLEAIRKKGGK